MLNRLILVIYLLSRTHKVALNLPFFIPHQPVRLYRFVVVCSLICSIFASLVSSVNNTKFPSGRVSKLMKEGMVFIGHVSSITIGFCEFWVHCHLMRPLVSTHLCVVSALLLHHRFAVGHITNHLLKALVVSAYYLNRRNSLLRNFLL